MKTYLIAAGVLLCSLLTYAGVAVLFKPDYAKSKVAFKIKNAGINVNGSFDTFECSIQYNEKMQAPSSVSATIQANSINTGIAARDKHLRNKDFFEVEKYPVITFTSAQVLKTSAGFVADGTLKIKDVSRSVKIPFTYSGDSEAGVFQGTVNLNRIDYHVGSNSMTMSDDVTVLLTVAVTK